jgi:hypothetical protein
VLDNLPAVKFVVETQANSKQELPLMKRKSAVALGITAAAFTLLITQLAPARAAQSNDTSSAAMQQAIDMVPAQAYLDQTVDANKVKSGDQITATLSDKVLLKNGTELPDGTELVGQVTVDQMQNDGTYRLALVFTNAQLRDGKVIPIKATIMGAYGPTKYPTQGLNLVASEPIPNNWNDQTLGADAVVVEGKAKSAASNETASAPVIHSEGHGIGEFADYWNSQTPDNQASQAYQTAASGEEVAQTGASGEVDLHSRIEGNNSGNFVSAKKDALRLAPETILNLAIAAQPM